MKKKLEAELISIAHRILKLKNKSDIVALHLETQKLYEKLSVLRFVEENFGEQKPTIGAADIEGKMDDYYGKESQEATVESPPVESELKVSEPTEVSQVKPEADDQKKSEIEQTAPEAEKQKETPEVSKVAEQQIPEKEEKEEKEKDEEENIPAEQQNNEMPDAVPPTVDEPETTVELKVAEEDQQKLKQEEAELNLKSENSAADEAAADEKTSVANDHLFAPAFELAFDPKTDDPVEKSKDESQFSFDDLLGKDYADPVFIKPDEVQTEKKFEDYTYKDAETIKSESKAVSLNDRLSKGITIGLNDRIAFIKHLFADSSEDYNRVLSQLMTFDSYDEARNFIEDMVKPDYNDWSGKEEYANRFMDIVEKRFS